MNIAIMGLAGVVGYCLTKKIMDEERKESGTDFKRGTLLLNVIELLLLIKR